MNPGNVIGRKAVGHAAAFLFAIQFALLDGFVRGSGAYARQPRLLGGVVASLALTLLVLRLVRRTRGRVLVALVFGGIIAAVVSYHRHFHAPLDTQAVLAARHAWGDVRAVLVRMLPVLAGVGLFFAALEFGLLRVAEPPRVPRWLLAGSLVAGLVVAGTPSAATPEIRAIHAAVAVAWPSPPRTEGARMGLPELESSRAELPHILFVITESVRASDACRAPGCPTGPQFDRALPDRVTFEQARSLSSYTAVSLAAIASGQVQLGSREAWLEAVDFFDLAHAARSRGSRYTVAYWSSQTPEAFERGGFSRVADEVVTAQTLLGHPRTDIEDAVAAKLDRRLADQCEARLSTLGDPRFIVLHLSGTHAPYAFDDDHAPFAPWRRSATTGAGLAELHNAYLNAIVEQDQSLGRCLRAFLGAAGTRPWIVVYTSDHGEAFGEHAAIYHGQNLYDEQVHVPLIVAHGNGALDPAQDAALRANARAAVTHLDLVPSLLDALGLDRHFALQGWKRSLPGRSLFRPLGAFVEAPLSNCTGLFPCPVNTWGVLGESLKLTANATDETWHCLSLDGGEREREPALCRALLKKACAWFPTLPNGAPLEGCER